MATSVKIQGSFLTTKELAKKWGCSPGHLANMRNKCSGPGYMKLPNGGVLYPVREVLDFENQYPDLIDHLGNNDVKPYRKKK